MGQPDQQDVDAADLLVDLINPKPPISLAHPKFEAEAEELHQQQGLDGGKEGALAQRAILGAIGQIRRQGLYN